MKTFTFSLVLLLLTSAGITLKAQKSTSGLQLIEKYHQFDFWIGEWDVFVFGTEEIAGKSDIISINDGMGLLENYESLKGAYKGKSLNTYNKAADQWEQYWIDNTGLVLKLTGRFDDGKMILTDKEGSARNRITWKQLSDSSVRQTWETSNDRGDNWTVAFDGLYRAMQ